MGGAQSAPTYSAVVPHGKRPGDKFEQNINGQKYLVTVPPNVPAGQLFKFLLSEATFVEVPNQLPPPAYGQTNNINYNNTNQLQPAMAPQASAKYQVTVPPNVFPGQMFQVNVNGNFMTVKCPMNGVPGQTITIEGPASSAVGTAAMGGGAAAYNAPPIQAAPTAPPPSASFHEPTRVQVTIPPGIYPNQQFAVAVGGSTVMITAPSGSHPGQVITVEVPNTAAPAPSSNPYHNTQGGYGSTAAMGGGNVPLANNHTPDLHSTTANTKSISPFGVTNPTAVSTANPQQPNTFKVPIPLEVQPGQSFEADVGGKKMMIQCPMNARAGMVLTIQGPSAPPMQQPQYQQQQPPQYQQLQYQQQPPAYAAPPQNNMYGAMPVAAAVSAPPPSYGNNSSGYSGSNTYGSSYSNPTTSSSGYAPSAPPQYNSGGGGAVMHKEF